MSKYQYRREDNDEIIEVDFETAMTQDAAGYIEIKEGRKKIAARRINRESTHRVVRESLTGKDPEIVSDSMGFPIQALGQWEEHRKRHGFKSVEFRRDKAVPEFVQVVGHNRQEWERYKKLRWMKDKNGYNGSSAILSPGVMEKTKNLVLRQR